MKKNKNNTLAEKYRPKYLRNVIGNEEIIKTLQLHVNNKSIPHMLFSGEAGIGKTTSAHAICNELYGSKKSDKEGKVLELNASSENGIDVIRGKVKNFAKYFNPNGLLQEETNTVPFGVVILDEAGFLTASAQAGLKRTMELFADRCRFILITNNFNKIIKPIRSRCEKHFFNLISNLDMINRAKKICEKESIKLSDEALEFIIKESNGDFRNVLNTLEIAKTHSINNPDKIIGIELFRSLIVEDTIYTRFVLQCINKKIKEAYTLLFSLLSKGIDLRVILLEIGKKIIETDKLPDLMKADILEAGMNCERLLVDGGNVVTSGLGYIGILIKIGHKYKKK